MASLREQILDKVTLELRNRTSMQVERLGYTNPKEIGPYAVVAGESDRPRPGSSIYVTRDFRVAVHVHVLPEHAGNANPLTLLDDKLTEVETVALEESNADQPLGLSAVQNVTVESSEPEGISEENVIEGAVFLSIEYRHDIANPSAYTATF